MAGPAGAGAFEFQASLEKTWEDEGELWFEGVASSRSLDRQSDRMSARAIEMMAECVPLDLLPDHKAGALQELGLVEKCRVVDGQFVVQGRLYADTDAARVLCRRIAEGRKYQLSVGGKVTKARREMDPVLGREVRVIEEVVLDHVALCRAGHAANADTYLTVMAKAAEGLCGDSSAAGLRGLARALLRVCRALWKSDPANAGHTTPGAERETPRERSEGFGELECELARVAEELDTVSKELDCGDEAPGGDGCEAEPDPGCRRSLELQDRGCREAVNLWKGVL
ncbi:MAG: hypothetical protein HPY44_00980 [Armatimonadetes bacterium]|nr:hypothetical protein [Armatimonadota bacterium]